MKTLFLCTYTIGYHEVFHGVTEIHHSEVQHDLVWAEAEDAARYRLTYHVGRRMANAGEYSLNIQTVKAALE